MNKINRNRKVVFYGLSLIISIFICTGCTGNITREIRHAGFNLSGDEFVCSAVLSKDEEKSVSKIRYILGNYMILEDGSIYELSMGRTFSNNENCKKAATDVRVDAILDSNVFRGTDGKYYYFGGANSTVPYSEVPKEDRSYPLYDILLKDLTNVKIITANNSTGTYYILKDDGNVYDYSIAVDKNTKQYSIISSSVLYNKNDYAGKIVDFNSVENSSSTFIKTEDRVYRMRVVNAEECNKYADVTCKYKIKRDKTFEEFKDNIIVFNGSTLITNYGKVFNVA